MGVFKRGLQSKIFLYQNGDKIKHLIEDTKATDRGHPSGGAVGKSADRYTRLPLQPEDQPRTNPATIEPSISSACLIL